MQCVEGFYHAAPYGRCLPCPNFCPTCNSPSACLTCAPGYYLKAGFCQPCSTPNCYSCGSSAVNNQCTLCRNGFYLNSVNTCSACPNSCDICSFNAVLGRPVCSTCTNGYFLSSISNNCSACSADCAICNDQNTCVSCSDGYYLTQDNTCLKCNSGCARCQSANTCSACLTGYFWNVVDNSSTAIGQCSRCQSPCFDCEKSATNCIICAAGYQLVS